MVRLVLGAVIGVIAGVAVIAALESIGHVIFPPPEGVNIKDPEVLKSIMDQIPLGAKISVLIAWGGGVLVGGIVARVIAQGKAPAASIVGLVLLALAGVTMVQIPHPIWMVIGAFVVTFAGIYGAGSVIKTQS